MDGGGGVSVPDLNFRYLNREGRWLDFSWQGLELRGDGALTLATIPSLAGLAPPGLTVAPDPSGPAGLAASPDGTIYYSLPDANLVVGITAGDPLAAPRGLAISRHRSALFICDSGNHRIRIVDLATSQLLETWDGFDDPVACAVDTSQIVYIADRGAKRIVKSSLNGDLDKSIDVAATADLVSLAVNGGCIYALDAASRTVLIFSGDGQPLPGLQWANFQRPMGLAITGDSIYIGDNGLRRVLRFRNTPGYPFVGEASGYVGPVAALAIGANAELLVHAGASTPLALQLGQAFVTSGLLMSRPIHASGGQVAWHNLHADVPELPAGSHIQFFVRTSDDPAPQPFPGPAWNAKPRDVVDLYVGGAPARFIWIMASFTGNGSGSPALTEVKVRFDQKTYFPFLPSVYDYPTPTREFFGRLLALFESFNVEDENALARLPELFDAAAIPAAYLPWLASWLAARLDQHWDAARQRQALRQAYAQYARRGTVAGLKEAIAFETGVSVMIEEPLEDASWWALPPTTQPCGVVPPPEGADSCDGGALGLTTMLAGPAPQGAVVGSTTVLDRSRILNAEDLGLPLFDELAHRFCVYLYRGAPSAQAQAVAAVVDREKPAHTSYHLCAIEPRMRVGFQARVGIDTVVGGPSEPSPLGAADSAAATTDGFMLGREDKLRIGVHSRIGDRLRI